MNSDALVSLSPAQIYAVYVIAALVLFVTFLCCIPRVSAICASVISTLAGLSITRHL
jgi:hypothetical protein